MIHVAEGVRRGITSGDGLRVTTLATRFDEEQLQQASFWMFVLRPVLRLFGHLPVFGRLRARGRVRAFGLLRSVPVGQRQRRFRDVDKIRAEVGLVEDPTPQRTLRALFCCVDTLAGGTRTHRGCRHARCSA